MLTTNSEVKNLPRIFDAFGLGTTAISASLLIFWSSFSKEGKGVALESAKNLLSAVDWAAIPSPLWASLGAFAVFLSYVVGIFVFIFGESSTSVLLDSREVQTARAIKLISSDNTIFLTTSGPLRHKIGFFRASSE